MTTFIRRLGDAILKEPCADVVDFSANSSLPQERSHLHSVLLAFQQENGFGRAIAAPQVGIAKRMIAFRIDCGAPGSETRTCLKPLLAALNALEQVGAVVFTMHNPSVTFYDSDPSQQRNVEHPRDANWRSEKRLGLVTLWDDCFSFPETLVRVVRYRWMSVRFTLDDGVTEVLLERLPLALAELVQHEFDHLDGILSFDRKTSMPPIAQDCEAECIVTEVLRQEFLRCPSKFNAMVDVPYHVVT